MTKLQKLELRLSDTIDGKSVTPANIPLGLLNDFNQQAAAFIRGGHRDVDLAHTFVGIEEGSYKLVVPAFGLIAGLQADLALLASNNLDDMDAKRAEIVEQWQQASQKSTTRKYAISDAPDRTLKIDSKSRYQRHRDGTWLHVEKYLYGQVEGLGGTNPNLHLRLADGQLLRVFVKQEQVLEKEQNPVYRNALLRVSAEEDLATGKLRNARLLDFAEYSPKFDPKAFEAMTEKGRRAWADVPNATEWVEAQRSAA